MSADHGDDGYPVGYGRPPRHSRFQKGQSGNPRGRPKRTVTLKTSLEKLLNRKLTVREGERIRRISCWEATQLSLINRAVRGDLVATRLLLQLIERLGLAREAETKASGQRSGVLVVPAPMSPEQWVAKYGHRFPDEVDWAGDLAREAQDRNPSTT